MLNAHVLRKYGFLCLLLLANLIAPLARGQNSNTGEIKGTVTDPSGAVVPVVTVSIKNVQTGVVTPTTTNGAGLYDVPFLAPGNYTITFSKQGFRDFVRSGVVLQIQTLEIDAALQLGAATQEVIVSGATPLVETETTGQHVALSAEAVRTAPIVGTDWRAAVDSAHSRRECGRGSWRSQRPGDRSQRHAVLQRELSSRRLGGHRP